MSVEVVSLRVIYLLEKAGLLDEEEARYPVLSVEEDELVFSSSDGTTGRTSAIVPGRSFTMNIGYAVLEGGSPRPNSWNPPAT